MSQSESEAPAVPARAKRGADTWEWSWVDDSVWTERMLAALENGVKGGRWYSLMDKVERPETLRRAWARVARNAGAAGVDGQSVARFAAREEAYLKELEAALKTGSYQPQPLKRVAIPKGKGKLRPLGIPAVKDRIVQTALKLVVEPIFEREFEASSYGFRPGRSCKDALREVDGLLKAGYVHVVDADVKGYFDSIPHAGLLARVAERISDGRVLALLESYLHQEVLAGLERWTPTQGTPQGAVISPLLGNVYLDGLDKEMAARGHRMVRYADDFVVLCRTGEEAEAAYRALVAWVTSAGLELHPDKTHVGDCRRRGDGFEFLGYRFEAGRRWVRRRSQQAFKDRIRTRTRRTRGVSIQQVVAELNPVIRGWFGYFRHADRRTFRGLDGFIRRRLRALLRRQSKRPGHGHTAADHRRWPNAYFAGLGLFTMHEAHRLACQSR